MEIAVISGKGGTGKSSISSAFATLNGECVIADCDVDAANLYLLFNPTYEEETIYAGGNKAVINYERCTGCGVCLNYCRFDAIKWADEKVIISDISCDGCFLCSRICPVQAIEMVQNDQSRMYSGSFRNGKMIYGRLAPGEENSGKLVNMVRDKARQVAKDNELEIIILDGPPGIGCPVISTITGADKVVIVTEPTISGLHDMQRTIEVVRKSGIETYIIINKYDLNTEMSSRIDKWCKREAITIAGHLPFDPEVVEAMVKGLSIIELDSDSSISRTINEIWYKIINKN